MMMAGPTVGFMELLVLMVFGGGGIMGLPPGERDALLLQCPPETAVLYVEWAARGEGEAGAPGIDGLAADPEIRQFLADVERAILATIKRETQNGSPEEKVLAQHVPPLVKLLLNRPGCAYVHIDPDAPRLGGGATGPGIEAMWLGIAAKIRGTVVIGGGESADAIADHVSALLDLLPEDSRGEGIDRQAIPFLPPGLSLTIHRHEDHFIVGFGDGSVDQAVAGLSGESQGLSASEEFQQAVEHVAIERLGGVSWINITQLTDDLKAMLGPLAPNVDMVMQTLGADKIESLVSTTGVVEGQILTRTFITTGGSTEGILALAAGRAIESADVAHIPADADLVVAFSLSGPKILQATRDVIGKAAADAQPMFEDLLDQLESELGFSIEEDFFAAFGDVWTIHDSPQAGGLVLTHAVAALEVKDAGKAEEVFRQLMSLLRQALPGEYGQGFWRRSVHLVEHEFLDHTVYVINTVGDDIPFAPAFCLTEKHLLVAPHPQALKAHLRFLDEGRDGFGGRLEKIADETDGELIALSHMRTEPVFRYLAAISPYLAQLAFSEIQRGNVEIDVFSFPSGRAIMPYLGDSRSTVTRTESGILIEGRSSLPIPGAGPFLMQVPVWFTVAMPARAAHFEAPAGQAIEVEAVPATP